MALGLLGPTQPNGAVGTVEHLVGSSGTRIWQDSDGIGVDSE